MAMSPSPSSKPPTRSASCRTVLFIDPPSWESRTRRSGRFAQDDQILMVADAALGVLKYLESAAAQFARVVRRLVGVAIRSDADNSLDAVRKRSVMNAALQHLVGRGPESEPCRRRAVHRSDEQPARPQDAVHLR